MARGFWGGLAASMGFGSGQPLDPSDERFWFQGFSPMSMAGIAVTEDAATGLDVVQSILARLSGTVSTLPGMVFRLGTDGTEQTPEPKHPLRRILFERPNDRQTPQEFWGELTQHLAFWRNSYGRYLPGTDYGIGGIEQIHPSRMQKIERRADGRVYYTFARLAPQIGSDTYRDDEIWHIRMPGLTVDGLRAKTMIELSKDTFGRALAVEQFGALYFKNGGTGGGIITHPSNFKSKEDEQSFMETWRAGGTGLNRHRDKLLKFGVTYQPTKVDNNEAQFLETLKEMAIKLCRLWNMPPHMVGILDKATLNNIAQQATDYVVYTISPIVVAIEQAIKRDLVLGEDADELTVSFNMGALLRGDFVTRYNAYFQGRQGGWLSVNDILRMEGRPTIGKAGDIYMMPVNMRDAAKPQPDPMIGHNGGPPMDPEDDPKDPEPGDPAEPKEKPDAA